MRLGPVTTNTSNKPVVSRRKATGATNSVHAGGRGRIDGWTPRAEILYVIVAAAIGIFCRFQTLHDYHHKQCLRYYVRVI